MTNHASTIHPFNDPTIEGPMAAFAHAGLEGLIASEWEGATADLVGAIERHPEVLENRSVLLNLALLEYRERQTQTSDLELEDYCQRFRHLGRSIEQSIFRQLETQQYLDNHPELLEMLEIPKWPEPGETFGSFQLLEELGAGGIARVYLATQADLGNRTVVVKATPFCSYEASILGRLNHPNIVPIHFADEVEEHNLSFLCMPYYGRSTLVDLIDLAFEEGLPSRGEIVRDAALRWLPRHEREAAAAKRSAGGRRRHTTYIGAVIGLALKMTEALQYAHERGIIHGDLKPSNVLLTPAGEPLLLDFNLSRDETAPGGACGGTLAYMPPEHLRQIAAGSDAAEDHVPSNPTSDIYSFGALVYELLAGRAPVALGRLQESPQVAATALLEQLGHPRVPLRQRNRQVPRGLDSLIMDCLAIDPADRPQTMAEVRRRLHAEARWPAEIARRVRRRPWRVATAACVLISCMAAIGLVVANQPPRHVTLYNSGIAAQEAGEWREAQESFMQALNDEPDYYPARLELGRSYIAQGQYDLALSTLEKLTFEEPLNPQLMELVAYVYNLKSIPTAAIAWYGRSIEHGGGSLATYNNLAASYLSGAPKLALRERLRLQELYLGEALEFDPRSVTVQLNVVRHSIVKAAADRSYDPREVLSVVQELRATSEQHSTTQRVLASWEGAVLRFERNSRGDNPQPQLGLSFVKVAYPVVHRGNLEPGSRALLDGDSKIASEKPLNQGFFLRPALAP